MQRFLSTINELNQKKIMKSLQSLVYRLTSLVMLLAVTWPGMELNAQTPVERLVADRWDDPVSLDAEAMRIATDRWDEYVSDVIEFTFNSDVARRVMHERPSSIRLEVPVPGGSYNFRLVEVKITTPDFRVESASGNVLIDKPQGVHYHGTIEGREGSLASVSFFDDWFTVIASSKTEGNFSVNKVKNSNAYVAYFDKDLRVTSTAVCLSDELDQPDTSPYQGLDQVPAEQRGGDPCVRMHYEMDYDFFVSKGSVSATAAWMEALHAQVAIMYANESVNNVLSYIHVWDFVDPFESQGGTGGSLQYLTNQYLLGELNGQANGDLIHLVALEANGGIAWRPGLCSVPLNAAVSQIDAFYSDFPVYTWSLSTIVHEIGHNLSSPHTHGCYWNGNDTQIDDCANVVGFLEGDCFDPDNPILPAEGGTVMSYCHFNVGVNLSFGFGPQPGDMIRNYIAEAECLFTCSEIACSPPFLISITDITETEAVVRWSHNTQTSFEVRYGYDGNWNTEQVDGADTLYLTGLEDATTYQVFIKTICDGAESEEFSEKFTTVCNRVFTLPYIESFDGDSWRVQANATDPCWSKENSVNDYAWYAQDFGTDTDGTGPDGDHTSGNGKYLYAEANDGFNFESTNLISPSIDLSSTTETPVLNFWYHMYGINIGRLLVSVSNDDGQNWNTVQTIVGQQQAGSDDPWASSTIELADYAGETIRIRFQARKQQGVLGDIAIDDIIVADEMFRDIGLASLESVESSCGLGANAPVSVDVVNLGFQTITTGTTIDLELKVNGSTVSNENIELAADLAPGESLPYTFAATINLSTPAEYNISVTSSLAGDQVGANNERVTVVSNIPVISTLPYIHGFEEYGGWTSGGVFNSWALGNPAKNVILGASEGTNAWVTGGLGTATHNADEESYVLGPCFDFSNYLDPVITLDVWWDIEVFWEGAQLQSSVDGGQTWQTIGDSTENWYNAAYILTMVNSEQDYFGGWSGTSQAPDPAYPWLTGSNGWVTVTHPLTGLAEEPSVLLRMLFISDPFVMFDGMAFDNVRITGTPISVPCHEIEFNFTTCNPEDAGQTVEVLQDAEGCDSIITTITALLESYDILIQEYSCDEADVGEVVTILMAQNGCDSVITERTDLWPSYDYTIMQETCDPEEVGTENLDLLTINGCDSLVEVITTLQDPYEIVIDQASCNPADTGSVEETLVASDGCDSIVTTNTALVLIEAGFTYVENEGVVTFTNTSSNATTYAWSFGDGNTNDVDNPTNTYTVSGDYTVTLIASAPGCASDTEIVVIEISIISGIDLISFIELVNVFPNPNDGNFVVELKGAAVYENLQFTLFNAAGSEVETRDVAFNSYARQTYNMHSLPNGIYFLRIRSDDEQTTLKVNVLR
jgi:hypothetical protein